MLKTLFFFICSTLYITVLYSQDMVKEGNSWNIAIYKGVNSPINTTYYVRIKGDITIDDQKYKFLEYKIPNTDIWESSIDYVRQEGQKVYFKRDKLEETLIYDFSLEKGDEFKVYSDCSYIVEAVDTVYTTQGAPRKRLMLVRQGFIPGEQYWIEGIGSNFGAFTHQNYCYFDYAEEFLCFYQESQLSYPVNPATCVFGSSSVATSQVKPMISFPNPVGDDLYIQYVPKMSMNYTIYDTKGRLYLRGNLDRHEMNIKVSRLPKGTYIIQANSGTELLQSRFVKM